MPLAPALRTASAPRSVVVARTLPADPVERARRLLSDCLATAGALVALPLERRAGGHARTFLFGDGATSVWAMTWDAGAETPVHDHHCACCFGVLAGALVERRFARVGPDAAACIAEAVRPEGFEACLVPDGPNIHQMLNLSGSEAISIHVYGFDRRLRANSIEREYRPVPMHEPRTIEPRCVEPRSVEARSGPPGPVPRRRAVAAGAACG